jgi:hypothetical protein
MKTEKTIFVAIAVGFLAVTLGLSFAKDSKLFGVLFFVELLVAIAFYLLRYGGLVEFRIEALSAKAEFIREKASEAESLVNEIQQVRDKILRIDAQLAETMKLAEPPALFYSDHTVEKVDNGLLARVKLGRSKDVPMAPILVRIVIPDESPATILSFRPSQSVGMFVGGEDQSLKDHLKIRRFQFQPLGGVVPLLLDITVSASTQLRLEANHGFEPVNLQIG